LDCGSDAKKLRQNMVAAGMEEPDFANSAHHIVMSNTSKKTNPKMFALREKMKNLGIDINDADNGIFLPKSSAVKSNAGSSLPAHSRIHTNTYKNKVYDTLINANTADEFRAGLQSIRTQIRGGTF
jgi:hypothetical protein